MAYLLEVVKSFPSNLPREVCMSTHLHLAIKTAMNYPSVHTSHGFASLCSILNYRVSSERPETPSCLARSSISLIVLNPYPRILCESSISSRILLLPETLSL
ncbi:hypothetical protein KC335_g177 [Hortaea werneckii]|nr:hypothetical protein KC335_g177 [Hortaea werneckii]